MTATSGCYQCGARLDGDSGWQFAPHDGDAPRTRQRLCVPCEEANKRAGRRAEERRRGR